MGAKRVEICALSSLLSPATDELESALLQSAPLDIIPRTVGRCSPSLRGLQVQFCQLQIAKGKVFPPASDSGRNRKYPARGGIRGTDAVTGRALSER
jgi:hypothetical protein